MWPAQQQAAAVQPQAGAAQAALLAQQQAAWAHYYQTQSGPAQTAAGYQAQQTQAQPAVGRRVASCPSNLDLTNPSSAEHTAAWAAYNAQQQAAQAAMHQHQQEALSGPHAAQWREYYAAAAAAATAAAAARPAPAAPAAQPQPAPAPAAPVPVARSYAAAASAPARAPSPASYNAVPPPASLAAAPWPAARAPAPAPPRPGFAAPYSAPSAPRPAYITTAAPPVARPQPPAGAAPKPGGGWPPPLRAWVERAFQRFSGDPAGNEWIKAPMKAIIDDATQRGELWTRDWDNTPLPQRPGQAPPPPPPPPAPAWQAPPPAGRPPPPPAAEWRPKRPRSRSHSRSRSRSRSSSPSDSRGRRPRHAPRAARKAAAARGAARPARAAPERLPPPPPLRAGEAALLGARGGRFGDGRAEGAGAAGETGTARRRAAVALQLSLAAEGEAGEAPDWDALTIKGTSEKLEKSYFRLTSAPDPATVRPPEVLARALARLQEGRAAGAFRWLYLNDQCKALRQDCTVQRLRSPLAAAVYRFHGVAALEAGDLAEYSQCAAVLAQLWEEGSGGDDGRAEWDAYRILYAAVARTRGAAVTRALRAAGDRRRHPDVLHALAVRQALQDDCYAAFFRLYRSATLPGARPLMDAAAEAVRFAGLRTVTRAYRPSLPLAALARTLGFEAEGGAGAAAAAAARAWLLAHGAVLIGEGEAAELDCRASAPLLFVPVDEKAVSHGDQELCAADFLKTFQPAAA